MCAHPQTPSHGPAPLGSPLLSSHSNFISFQEAAVLLSMIYRSFVFPGSVRMFGFVPALLAEHPPPTPRPASHFLTAIINSFHHKLHPRKQRHGIPAFSRTASSALGFGVTVVTLLSLQTPLVHTVEMGKGFPGAQTLET